MKFLFVFIFLQYWVLQKYGDDSLVFLESFAGQLLLKILT